MLKILYKQRLNKETTLYNFYLPEIADRAKPGQFVILRVDVDGERIPLTIADFDREKGIITIVVQEVGATTKLLSLKKDVAGISGPLGKAVPIAKIGRVICVGGGVGVACIYPVARAYKNVGNEVVSIIGARTKETLIFENKISAVSREILITTNDGSCGERGFVTDCLDGMCGACRVTVNGKVKFACVDGPHFNAHQVDFSELIARQNAYQKEEKCRNLTR